ncbi:MAG TPA: Ger(x)C family spore germination protein [Firmicutes bacterium]|nr:Ger(x)C family spore germination protein [Candidatus Fermentithermobacillaceae bacterium]
MIPTRSTHVAAYVAIMAVLISLTSGCWNRREIETLGFVMAIGLDESPSGRIQLTVQFAKPGALAGGTEAAGRSEKPFWVSTVEGDTVFECFRHLGSVSTKRPYLQHNRFIIFGDELLKNKGLMPVIDFFNRDAEARLASQVLAVKGATAREYLQAEFEGASLPSEGEQGMLLYLETALGTISPLTFRELEDRMGSEGIEPIAVGVEVVPLKPDTSIKGELTREEVKSTARLGGTAVFKGDYLVGWLDEYETRGLNWILGKVKSTLMVFPQPGFEDRLATIEILRSTGNFKVEVRDDSIVASIHVDTIGNLGEVQEPVDFVKQPETWGQFEKGLEAAIKQEIMQTVTKLQALGADAIGFGQDIFRRKPKDWANIRGHWDDLFPTVKIHVQVKAKLRTPGMVLKSVKTR